MGSLSVIRVAYVNYLRLAAGLLLASMLAGCASAPNETASVRPTKTAEAVEDHDSKDSLFDQLHAGYFALQIAIQDLGDALPAAKEAVQDLRGNDKEGAEDALQYLDSAGARLAEFEDEPTEQAVNSDQKKFQKLRKALIDAANDSLHETREAESILAGIADFASAKIKAKIKSVIPKIQTAKDDVAGLIEALGGQIEVPSD